MWTGFLSNNTFVLVGQLPVLWAEISLHLAAHCRRLTSAGWWEIRLWSLLTAAWSKPRRSFEWLSDIWDQPYVNSKHLLFLSDSFLLPVDSCIASLTHSSDLFAVGFHDVPVMCKQLTLGVPASCVPAWASGGPYLHLLSHCPSCSQAHRCGGGSSGGLRSRGYTATELAPCLAFSCALLVLNQLPLPLVLHPTRMQVPTQDEE